MSAEKKVPEIRFKGFSGDWLNNPIVEICGSTFGGGTPSTSEKSFWQGDIPWIQSSDLKEGSVNSVTVKKHITKAGVNKSATKLVSGNSIAIVTRVGVGKLSLMESEYTTSQDFLSLSDLKVDMQYSAYVIWKLLQIEKEQVQGTSIKGITKEELLSKTISFPEAKLEQIAIGNTFQKLDCLINQHQQKHDKLSSIKKAMLEKMFPKQGETTPEIRFKGFSKKWEEKVLSENVTFINGRAYSQEELLDKGKYTVLRVGNFYTNSSWYYSDMELGDKYYADYGDLLYTWSASFGPHVWQGGKVIYHYHIWKLELSENIDKLFLLHLLDYDREKILSGSNGSTMIHITKSAMEAKKLFIPKKEEQTIIGNYFQKLDTLISQHKIQITKLNNIKQACLSKMFV